MKKIAVLFISMVLLGLTACGSRNHDSLNQGLSSGSDITSAGDSEADILLLDVPLNGLDKDGAEDIETLCDTVCEMDKGVLSVL